jgi:addiction module HigA family antidote
MGRMDVGARMKKRKRKPAHPGKILQKHYLEPLNLPITQAAQNLGVSRKAISAIVNERKSVTPDMAYRLAQLFETTPQFWANLQMTYDLWEAAHTQTGWEDVKPLYSQ